MAVLKNNRSISRYEYEHTFEALYTYCKSRMQKIPKRRKKWQCAKINTEINGIYSQIMDLGEAYFPKENKKALRGEAAEKICDRLNELEKPLMVYWNVNRSTEKEMKQWIEAIQNEIRLLNHFIIDGDERTMNISILHWEKINNAYFTRNMAEQHRYVHGKVVNSKGCYDDTDGAQLVSFVDDAFYCVMKANEKMPTTQKQYEQRKKLLSRAIADLNKMNRPMLCFFNLMQYSERVMREWAELLSQQLKMLYAIQKSDQERFQHLP